MTEEQLAAFLSVDKTAQEQLQQLSAFGARIRLEQETEEIVVEGPTAGRPSSEVQELARVAFKPEASASERRYAAHLLLLNAGRAYLGQAPAVEITLREE